jgi:hypothetical protein
VGFTYLFVGLGIGQEPCLLSIRVVVKHVNLYASNWILPKILLCDFIRYRFLILIFRVKILGKRRSLLLIVGVAGPTVYGDFGGLPQKYTLFDQIIHCIRIQLPQHSSVWLYSSISDFEIGGGKKRKKLSKLLGNVTKVSQAFHSIFFPNNYPFLVWYTLSFYYGISYLFVSFLG